MVVPVRAKPSQSATTEQTPPTDNQGSYPAEISRDQFVWLQERAEERRREWVAHAQSLACNPKP